MALNINDASVTWNGIKNRVEKWLKEKRGINGDDRIAMGTIDYAMTVVWNEFLKELDKKEDGANT